MKTIIIIITIQIFFVSICISLPEDPVEYAAWEQRALKSIQQLSQRPPEEAIPGLSLRLRQISRPGTPNYEQGDRPVFRAAQKALLSIPGHAEYYRNRIKEARLKYEHAMQDEENRNVGGAKNDLYNEQMYGFQTLRNLPSSETVRVLGEFLFDERGMPNLPSNPTLLDAEKARAERPNSIMAARALNELPLVTRPYPKKDMYSLRHNDVHPWRLWYEQVKAGTRTFSFEGDPHEYTLDGPARETKHGPATNRLSKRGEVDEASIQKHETGFTPTRAVMTAMAALLCLWALWRCWKMRPESTRG